MVKKKLSNLDNIKTRRETEEKKEDRERRRANVERQRSISEGRTTKITPEERASFEQEKARVKALGIGQSTADIQQPQAPQQRLDVGDRAFVGLKQQDIQQPQIQQPQAQQLQPQQTPEIEQAQAQGILGAVEEAKQELIPTAIQQEFTEAGGQLTEQGEPIFVTPNVDLFRDELKKLGYTDEQVNRMVKAEAPSLGTLVNSNPLLASSFQTETTSVLGDIVGRVLGPLGGAGGQLIGVNLNDVIQLFTNSQDAEQLESAMGKLGETFSGIRGIADANGLNLATSLAQLEQQQSNLQILEFRIKQAVVLNPQLKQSGRYTSILAELDKTKIELEEARADILLRKQEAGNINVAQTQFILEQLKK